MMRKLITTICLVLLALVALVVIPTNLALANSEKEVCLVSLGPGRTISIGYEEWAGLFNMTVDGVPYDGWCIDLEHFIFPGICSNATLTDALRETPKWCEIAYIITNYSPDSDTQAAAIQLAIWKYLHGGRDSIVATDCLGCSYPLEVEDRACEMYDAAIGKSVIGPSSGLTLEPHGDPKVEGSVASQDFMASITDSGCLGGIVVQFSTNNGTLSSDNVNTSTDGKALVTLQWDTSQCLFTANLTAHTEGRWPVKIEPVWNIQRTMISEYYELTDEEPFTWECECFGEILIHKVDTSTPAKFLSGATFTITDNNTGSVVYEVTDNDATDNNTNDGIILIKDVPCGKYNISETGVPSGYFAITGSQTVNVSSGPAPGPTIFENEKCELTCYINCNPQGCGNCEGEKVTLTESGGQAVAWEWSTGADTPSINVTASGTYTVKITDEHGCTSSCNKTVEMYDEPSCNITCSPEGCGNCKGGEVTLTEDGGDAIKWKWSTNETTQSISVSASGTYTVEIEDEQGCTSSCNKTVEMYDEPSCNIICIVPELQSANMMCFPPPPPPPPSPDCVFCEGSSIILKENGGYAVDWVWKNADGEIIAQSTDNITVTEAGTYSVEITDEQGCTSSCNKTIGVYDEPICHISCILPDCHSGCMKCCPPPPPTECILYEGSYVTLKEDGGDAIDWLWKDASDNVIAEGIDNIMVTEVGTYYVTITDEHGCTSTCFKEVTGGIVECGPCEGKVTWLTLKYHGASEAFIEVRTKCNDEIVFSGNVSPGAEFSFSGNCTHETLGTEIEIYINGELSAKIHTSCSQPIGPGLVRGDFEVIAGESRFGGPLCPINEGLGAIGNYVWADTNQNGIQDDSHTGVGNVKVYLYRFGWMWPIATTTTDDSGHYLFDELAPADYYLKFELPKGYVFTLQDQGSDAEDSDADTSSGQTVITTLVADEIDLTWDAGIYRTTLPCGPCEGKVTSLILKYLGSSGAHVVVRTRCGSGVVFDDDVVPDGEFSFNGNCRHGTLGTEIKIYVDGELNAKIHTSCSQPIGPGLVRGDFEVIAGESRFGGPLCPIP